jgi:hypothetical protein
VVSEKGRGGGGGAATWEKRKEEKGSEGNEWERAAAVIDSPGRGEAFLVRLCRSEFPFYFDEILGLGPFGLVSVEPVKRRPGLSLVWICNFSVLQPAAPKPQLER